MDWLERIRERSGRAPMPMAELFSFELLSANQGSITARALPESRHYNPLGVIQGGFAATVLDMALGLVSLSVLPSGAKGVSTVELSVKYLRPLYESTGWMTIEASILHAGSTLIVGEARLSGENAKLYATAQSSSLIVTDCN